MVAPARLDIFFGIGDFGWSTDHYYQTQISDLTNGGFVAACTTLIQAYANCLAYGITIDAARASLNGVWRDSVFFKPPLYTLIPGSTPPSFAYSPYVGNGPSGDPFDGINFRLEMGQNYRASEILSGLPAGSLVQPATYPWNGLPYAATYTKITSLMSLLTGALGEGLAPAAQSSWGGLVRAKGADGPATNPLTSAVVTNAGEIIFATFNANTLGIGDPVRILGVTQPPNIPKTKVNGTYNVTRVIGGNSFAVAQPTAAIGTTFFAIGGTAQQIILVLQPYTKWNFINQTHRKRGRRFGAPRGRSKRRAPGAVV